MDLKEVNQIRQDHFAELDARYFLVSAPATLTPAISSLCGGTPGNAVDETLTAVCDNKAMKRLVLPALLMLSACATNPPVDTTGWTYAPHELTPPQRQAMEAAIKATLRDPDSAQFSRLKARKVFIPGDKVAIQACVFVNARNSFGGFAGAAPVAGVFPYYDHSVFHITSWLDPRLAPAVAEGCAQMGLLAMN